MIASYATKNSKEGEKIVKKYVYFFEAGRRTYAQKIVEKIKKLIQTNDDIVILQEFPLEIKEIIEGYLGDGFKLHSWYLKEKEQEQENGNDGREKLAGYPKPNVPTVAITTSDSNWELVRFEELENKKMVLPYGTKSKKIKGEIINQYNYTNRYIVMQHKVTKEYLLGIHIELSYEKRMWEGLLEILSNPNVADVANIAYIVGDFNFNGLLKSQKEKDNYYKELENKGYHKMIDDDIITNNQTIASIDNIFMKEAAKGQMVDWRVIDYCWVFERKKFRYSDHNLCYVELQKSENNN